MAMALLCKRLILLINYKQFYLFSIYPSIRKLIASILGV
jgi:hypothetical protein